nr:putative reverse transcriptase domain-containing protein [Tanacetum cinerariifolium]
MLVCPFNRFSESSFKLASEAGTDIVKVIYHPPTLPNTFAFDIQDTKGFIYAGSKGKTDKNKKVVPYQPKSKKKRKENPNKDQTCHHCHVAGHWKRNCPLYLEELRKNIDKAEHGAAASEFAVPILNMVLTKKVDKTPYEIWHGKAPNLSFPPENKVIVTRYGNFLEIDLISQKFNGRNNDLEDDHMDTLPSENTSEIPVESESLGSLLELIHVRRSERTTRAPNHLSLNIEVEDDEVGDLGEPANYKDAMIDPDKVVRTKWLYNKKTDMDGKVHTYKARRVAKGCTQTYGIDYEETFSLVADIRAIRILVAISAYYDYEFIELPEEHKNVHNTFHVSNLKKCVSNESLVIPMKELRLDDKLNFVEAPVNIIDREVKQLKHSRIPIVKVRWNSKRGPEFTWECEDEIRAKYPHLFSNITLKSN